MTIPEKPKRLRGRPPVLPEKKTAVQAKLRAGLHLAVVADLENLGISTVAKIRDEAGIPANPVGRPKHG